MASAAKCWCGNRRLLPFSPDYLRCASCETLVLARFPERDPGIIADDSGDLYGKDYFEKHLSEDYGLPGFAERVRGDLPERNLFWLETLLRFTPPKGSLLELGCFHGGFVALARMAGFDARGLELSPATCRRARQLFGIEVLEGRLEDQKIPGASLGVIAHFDVLEHLWDPLATMKLCRRLLAQRGVMLVQTPRYPEGATFERLTATKDPFLTHLKPEEHLFLFSKKSVVRLLRRAGFPHHRFEPAIFAHYDQFLATSSRPLHRIPPKTLEKELESSATGRIALALLDLQASGGRGSRIEADSAEALKNERNLLSAQLADLSKNFKAAEADRVARGKVIDQQGVKLAKLEAEHDRRLKELAKLQDSAEALRNERNLLKAQLADLQRNFDASEKDRVARGKAIDEQGTKLSKLEAEHDKRLKELAKLQDAAEALRNERNLLKAQLADLQRNFDASEKDRVARGAAIDEQGAKLSKLEAEHDKRLKELSKLLESAEALRNERNLLKAQLADLQRNFEAAQKDRVARGKAIDEQGAKLSKLEAEHDTRLKELANLHDSAEALKNERNLIAAQLADTKKNFAAAEKDRVARGKAIDEQGAKLSKLEAEHDTRLKELANLHDSAEALKNERNLIAAQLADTKKNFAAAEKDRVARGKAIDEQGAKLSKLEAEHDRRLKELAKLQDTAEALKNERNLIAAQLADTKKNFAAAEKDRVARGKAIDEQGAKLSKLEAEHDRRLKELAKLQDTAEALKNERNLIKAQFADLQSNFDAVERDRIARGETIDRLGAEHSKLEAEFDKRLKELAGLQESAEALKNERNLLAAQLADTKKNFAAAEKDRVARGKAIDEQGAKLSKLEAEHDRRLKELAKLQDTAEALKNERNLLKSQLADLQENFDSVEKDRFARGETINQLGAQHSKLEAEFDRRLRELNTLQESAEAIKNERNLLAAQLAEAKKNFAAAEKDRIARGETINHLGAQHSKLEAEHDRRLKELAKLQDTAEALKNERNLLKSQLADLQENFDSVEKDRFARGETINQLGAQHSKLEAEFDRRLRELNTLQESAEAIKNERNLLEAQLADLRKNFDSIEQDRIARGAVIEKLGREGDELRALIALTETDRNAWKGFFEQSQQKLAAIESELKQLGADKAQLLESIAALERKWWVRMGRNFDRK